MSPVVRVSQDVYNRLELKAVGFDTPSNVIGKLLDFHDEHQHLTRGADVKDNSSRISSSDISSGTKIDFSKLSPKEQGKERRFLFQKLLLSKGIEINKEKEVIYNLPQIPGNNCAGIATASESEDYPGTWFLGLPNRRYYAIVLLCGNSQSPKCVNFILSNQFIKEKYQNLSMDSNNQKKFHVYIDTYGSYFLRIPGSEEESIDRFRDRYDNLKQISDIKHSNTAQLNKNHSSQVVIRRRGKKRERLHSSTLPSFNDGSHLQIPEFENKKAIRLKHIYFVLYYMSNGCKFSKAVHKTLEHFPKVQDYQTISDACARRFAGDVNTFISLYRSGEIIGQLIDKFHLSENDQRIFRTIFRKN